MPILPIPVKITSLPAISSVADNDVLPIVDISDTSSSASGTTKKITLLQIADYIGDIETSNIASARVATTGALAGTYANGSAGSGATFTLTATGVLTIDGIATALNNRILVNAQASTFQNGVYYVSTAGALGVQAVLTRVVDWCTSSQIEQGDFIAIVEGTTNGLTLWEMVSATPLTVGTDAITFSNMTGAVAGIIPLNKGGTNKNNTADNGAIAYSDATGITLLAHVTTAGKVLQSGNAAAPTWSTPTYPSASGTANKFLISDGTNNVYSAFTMALGGNVITAGDLTLSGAFAVIFNFSGATNVTFPTSGTLATTAQTLQTANVTANSTSMVVNTSYTINNGALATLTLPAVSAVGDIVEITGNSASGWSIAQNAGQNIQVVALSSTVGVGGSVASTNRYDSIRLKCVVANTTWITQCGASSGYTIV